MGLKYQCGRLNERFTGNYPSLPRLITGEVEEGLVVDEVQVE